MICPVCGSSEFDLHEGLFYCCECHTQIKESRDERDDTEAESIYSGYSIRTPEREKSSGDEEPPPKQWITAEAYNIIISKQVAALIDLGASPKLKDAVFYIWAKYLQKCEIAFRKDYNAGDKIPALGVFPRKRDLAVVLGTKQLVRRSKRLHKIQNKSKKKKIEDSGDETVDDDLNTTTDQLSTDASMDSDIVSDVSQSQDSDSFYNQSEAPKKRIFSSLARKAIRTYGKKRLLKFNNKKHNTSPDHMTLSKTLCFCYLGLLYIEDQLLLCDLIRFVMEGRVPYMNSPILLSHSLHLDRSDHPSITVKQMPCMKRICVWAANIIEFLNLPKYKHPFLMPIAARLIKDLNFPDEFIPMVKSLVDKLWTGGVLYNRKQMNGYFSIPLYEVKVAAYIITALKMLFTLDGVTEKEHSKVVRKINAIRTGGQLFVWDDWEQAWKRMAPFLKNLNFICYSMSSVDLLDANSLAEHFATIAEQPNGSYLSKEKKNDQSTRSIMRNILDSVAPRKETFLSSASSFPLRSQLGNLRINATSLHPYNETENLGFFSYEDFSLRSLSYIPDHDKINNAELEELYGELGSKFYELQDEVEIIGETHVVNSKYWHMNCFWKKLPSTIEQLPEIFVWLLDFVSKSIATTSNDLYHEIIKIERVILRPQMKNKLTDL